MLVAYTCTHGLNQKAVTNTFNFSKAVLKVAGDKEKDNSFIWGALDVNFVKYDRQIMYLEY